MIILGLPVLAFDLNKAAQRNPVQRINNPVLALFPKQPRRKTKAEFFHLHPGFFCRNKMA